jgi:hypothetical protein
MQGALTNIESVLAWVEMNNTPYWRLFSGSVGSRESYPLMSQMKEGDLKESKAVLESTLKLFNHQYGGVFNILLSKDSNNKDNSGSRANITLGTANDTGNAPKVAGIGSLSLEEMDARIAKAVALREKELKTEYEHKNAIGKLQEQIDEMRDDAKNDWSPERIGSIVEKVALHPITMMILTKALGINGAETMKAIQGIQDATPSHVSDGTDEDKIEEALDMIDESGIGNTAEILMKVAKFAKSNPEMAKNLLNNIPQTQNMAQG